MVYNEMAGEEFDCDNGGSFPIFVGGSSHTTPPFPWGPPPRNPNDFVHSFSKYCMPWTKNFTDPDRSEYCWRSYCPVDSGDFILRYYNFPETQQEVWLQLAILCVFLVA